MQVYLDLVVLLNFSVDFLLLLGTNRLSGHPPGCKRAALSALLGGLYAGACMIPGFYFLGNLLWRLVSLILIAIAAFGWGHSSLRRGILFVFLSMSLGGVAVVMNSSGFWSLLMAAGILCAMCILGFRGRVGQAQYVPITITYKEFAITLTALVDTGNTLRDPVSGSSVLVVDARVAEDMLSLSQEQLARPIETMYKGIHTGLRLVPYCAVGQRAGMLLAFRPDSLTVNGKPSDCLVAFAPQRIGQGSDYQALVGGAL